VSDGFVWFELLGYCELILYSCGVYLNPKVIVVVLFGM
jgi:hypothetical protein